MSEPSTSSASRPTSGTGFHWLSSDTRTVAPSTQTSATPWPTAIARRRPAYGMPTRRVRERAGAGASAPAAALTTESDQMTSPNQTTSAIQTITKSNLVRTPVRAQSGPGLSSQILAVRRRDTPCSSVCITALGSGRTRGGGGQPVVPSQRPQGGHHGLAELASGVRSRPGELVGVAGPAAPAGRVRSARRCYRALGTVRGSCRRCWILSRPSFSSRSTRPSTSATSSSRAAGSPSSGIRTSRRPASSTSTSAT